MSGPQVAYLGLGSMGSPIAARIANNISNLNYPPLLVYNRTTARSEELKKTHLVEVAISIEQVAKVSDIVFSCFLNDTIVSDAFDVLLAHLKPGSIIVDQSTIAPALAQELDRKSKEQKITYFACPIVGPPASAVSGNLLVLLAGGNKEVRTRIIPLLIPVIGKKIIELGENPAESLRLKFCCNTIVLSLIEAVAEGFVLGEASGVGQEKVNEFVNALFPNTLLSVYAARMVNNTYKNQVAASLTAAQEVVGHILQLGKDSGAQLSIMEIFKEHTDKALEDYGNLDATSVICCLREKAGLHPHLE